MQFPKFAFDFSVVISHWLLRVILIQTFIFLTKTMSVFSQAHRMLSDPPSCY